MQDKPWQDWVLLVAAAWLFLSPFALDFAELSHPGALLAWTCAIVLYLSASEALVVPDALEEVVDLGVGLSLVLGPWILGFGGNAAANSVLIGLLVTGFAASAFLRDLRWHVAGHHWDAHV
jgi:hypothetical protein